MPEIRLLTPDDAEAWRDLRLRGLEAEPFAFGTSAYEQRALPLETVAERLRAVPDGAFTLGVFEEGTLVGSVGFFRHARPKTRHRGDVVGMFVAPAHRGRGVGRALMLALLDRLRGIDGLERAGLSVWTGADAARALYRSLGFEGYGIEIGSLKVDGVYADLELMTLDLRREA